MAICRAYLFRQAFHLYSIHRSQHSTASSQLLLNTCGRAQHSRPNLSRHLYVMSMHERQRAHVTITTSVYTRDCGHGPGVKQVQMCVPSHLYWGIMHLYIHNIHYHPGNTAQWQNVDNRSWLRSVNVLFASISVHSNFREFFD